MCFPAMTILPTNFRVVGIVTVIVAIITLLSVIVEFPLFRGQVNIGQLMLRLHDTAVHS